MMPSRYSVTAWQGRTTRLASLADHLSDVAQGSCKISRVPLPAVVLRHSGLLGQSPASPRVWQRREGAIGWRARCTALAVQDMGDGTVSSGTRLWVVWEVTVPAAQVAAETAQGQAAVEQAVAAENQPGSGWVAATAGTRDRHPGSMPGHQVSCTAASPPG